MNNQIGNKINDKTYIPLPPFKGWVLENFPFIEDDFDCLTNYQMLCLMFKKLNEVISNQNTVQELGSELVVLYNALVDAVNSAINEFETEVTADINQFKIDTNTEISNFETFITGKFNELKDYVDNFFDNNFPQLVSDKLDEMASDGTLENLLNDTAHLIKVYNTYTDMIADSATFTNGLRLKTLGYYSINDGGGAEYYVNNSVISSNYQIELSNDLYLNLVIDNVLNVDKIGAKGDGTTDDTSIVQSAVDYCIVNRKSLEFSAKYYLLDNINFSDVINIFGTKSNNFNRGTIIKAIESEYPLFNFYYSGGTRRVGGSINDIAFMASGERQEYTNAIDKICIKILNFVEMNMNNVFISGFKLGGIYAQDYMDSCLNSVEIRCCGNSTGDSALYLGSGTDSSNSLHFFGLHIENCPYQLHINDICSHIQFVASKFEVGDRFATPYTHMIEIYEGVYNIEFTSCFFTNGRNDCDFILVKNNLTTFNSCVFASSTKNLIKNYSANANYGKGIIINACTFEEFGSENNINLGQNGILTNNYFQMKNTINNPITLTKSRNIISNNLFNINDSVTSGTIFNAVGEYNEIKNNNYSNNYDINVINNIVNEIIDTNRGNFKTLTTSSFVVDFNKVTYNIFWDGGDVTFTSSNFINPKITSKIYIYSNSGTITFDTSLLPQQQTLRSGHYVEMVYINAIQKWAFNEDKLST